jgi:hypothetical protein
MGKLQPRASCPCTAKPGWPWRNFLLAFRAQSGENSADMRFWYYFWTANFIVAGLAFALITLVVLVRGSQDLREMFAGLKRGSPPPAAPPPEGPPVREK